MLFVNQHIPKLTVAPTPGTVLKSLGAFQLLNSLASQGVLPPLENAETKLNHLAPMPALFWFPSVQRQWSFRATGKDMQGRKRGKYKGPVQENKTIQLIVSRLTGCIRGRKKMLYSIDEFSVCK